MDARVDRRTLLRKLIDDRFHGSVAEFARAIRRSPSQVHQWLHGHRRLGDAGARHIERTLPGLWQGYFDGEPPPAERDLERSAPESTVHHMEVKTVEEVRRENLARLVTEAGGVARLAEILGRSSSQISQWLNASPDSKTGKPRTISGRSARLIEARLGKAKGWMDQDHSGQPIVHKQLLEPKAESFPAPRAQHDQVLVPIYDVSAAAGAGAFVEGEQVADHLLVRADWLRELVGYLPSSDRVAIIQVRGDSMEPTLSPGDLILVERRTFTREELTDGIYVVRLEGALLVKRLQFVPGGIALISDNERYERQVVPDVEVIARVIYAWRGKKM